LYNLPATLSPTSEKDDSEEVLSPSRIYLLFLRNIHTPIPAPLLLLFSLPSNIASSDKPQVKERFSK